jgi:hypothetical protein
MNDKLLDDLAKRVLLLEKQVKALQANAAPTIPIYDSTNFPQDAVEGQIVIAP